jgi:hypothetical protein
LVNISQILTNLRSLKPGALTRLNMNLFIGIGINQVSRNCPNLRIRSIAAWVKLGFYYKHAKSKAL